MNRPVNILSAAFKPSDDGAMLRVLNGAIHKGLDLLILPEACLGDQTEGAALDSGVVKAVCEAASAYGVNIVLPLYTSRGDIKRINTALVIDRGGCVAASYHKLYPYWSEFDLDPPCAVTDGGDCVVQLDFGRIGLAVCFDANFPGVWQNLSDLGAELVVWSSAYSAGSQLAAYGLIHHYPIATCTQVPDAALYDIDGRETLYKKGDCGGGGRGPNGLDEGGVCLLEYTVDLDRRIFHYNFNQDKAEKLIAEHGDEIEIEKDYLREQWFILRSRGGGAGAARLAEQYGLTELTAYQRASREKIDAMRVKLPCMK